MSASAPLPVRLDPPVDPARDHVLGEPGADLTLVEYGSYACPHCHAAHEVIAELRDRMGARLRYVFRQRPIRAEAARPAAELAEAAGLAGDRFWEAHDLLMRRGPSFAPGELDAIARELGLPPRDGGAGPWEGAAARVREDVESARRSGVHLTPTFFIGGRRYEGPWDASSLTEALLGSLGHRLHAATVDFARWAPSTGLLLLAATALAVAIASSPAGDAFAAGWRAPLGLSLGGRAFALPLAQWVNDGLLTLFLAGAGGRQRGGSRPPGQVQAASSGASTPCSCAYMRAASCRLRSRSLACAPVARRRGTRSITSMARLNRSIWLSMASSSGVSMLPFSL
jgi:NhaA family Na+:H+ antiporter